MTVILAIKGVHHVAIFADSLGHSNDADGMYRHSFRKLRTINGKWVIGVSHSQLGLEVVNDLGSDPLNGLHSIDRFAAAEIASRLLSLYQAKGFHDEVRFVLGGVGAFGPFIHEWWLKPNDDKSGVTLEGPYEQSRHAVLGASRHGALYFLHGFNRLSMSIPQHVLLGFHCVAEVAKHDVRVDRPVDVAVATESGVAHYTESDLPQFVERSAAITKEISVHLNAEDLTLS